jgi:UPF0755 protein
VKNKTIIIAVSILMVVFVTIKIVTLPPAIRIAKLVEIPEGATAESVAEILEEKGVIKRSEWFLYLTNRYRVQEKLQAGIYEFSGRVPLRRVISKIVMGDVLLVRVTIPEGYTVKDIAKTLEKKKLCKSDEFIEYAEKEKLEGFLFPDTYLFPHKVSVEAIVNTMFRRFKNVFEGIYGEEITDANFHKVKDIVIVASIVEKEAMYNDGKDIIAGIIHRRLKKKMPLQSCATVLYAMGKPKARLSSADLKIRSPYNTYIHKGLPPGPICNPGLYSLKSAINPPKTDYLYFVSMGNGRNYFSKTYQEHIDATKRFLFSETKPETAAE